MELGRVRDEHDVAADQPPAPARTVHIDTSLQIEQQKVESKAKPVREALARYAFTSTSSYARKEFKRAWLQDLNLIYKATRGAKQIGDVYSALGKSLWHQAAHRRRERCLDAINAFLSPHPDMPLNVAVIRLRAHVAEAILGAFTKWERSVTHEYHGTECVRATERPARAMDGTIDCTVRECKPSKIQCSVHKFYQENQSAFQKIESAVRAAGADVSDELKKSATTIRSAKKDSKRLCDSHHCTAMNDAIIAVDGIRSDHFAANNDKEWKLLARALGKPLLNPVTASMTPPQNPIDS